MKVLTVTVDLKKITQWNNELEKLPYPITHNEPIVSIKKFIQTIIDSYGETEYEKE